MESSLQSESMNCLSATKTRCSSGILLPAWEPSDNISYNDSVLRSTVYFLCLLYMFLGVSIIADKFMTSIEVITSKEKQLVIKRKGIKQVRVFKMNESLLSLSITYVNFTFANDSLMDYFWLLLIKRQLKIHCAFLYFVIIFLSKLILRDHSWV